MLKSLEELIEDKARAGDGTFAVAFAILKLAEAQEQVAIKLGRLGFDGPGGHHGALEYIGSRLGDISSSLECFSINASISGSLDVNNG